MIAPSSPTRKGRRTRGGRGKGPGRGRGRGGGAAGRGSGRGQHNTNNNKNTNDIAVNVSNKEQPQDNTDATPSQKKNVLGTTKEKTSTTTKSGVAFQVNTAPVDIELDNHHTKKKYGELPILSNKERRNQQKKERDRIKNESLQKQKENMCNITDQNSSATTTGKHPSSKKVSFDAKDMTRPASKQNKSTPQPSSKDGSTLKNIDEHSTSNTNKGANNKKKKAVTISENVGTRDSSKDAPPLEEEPEKERKARLLREAREKSALAKEKKKSKKGKKHDKWVKQQEAEKSARVKSWYVFF